MEDQNLHKKIKTEAIGSANLYLTIAVVTFLGTEALLFLIN